MQSKHEHTCPHCGNDHNQSHSHFDLEKAEKGEIKKVSKSKLPYTIANSYELEFKKEFGKEVGDMGNSIMKLLNQYTKTK